MRSSNLSLKSKENLEESNLSKIIIIYGHIWFLIAIQNYCKFFVLKLFGNDVSFYFGTKFYVVSGSF